MKKRLVLVVVATAVLSAPAAAYTSNKYLHSYSPKDYTMQIGLCGDADWFPFAWRPCWWV